MTPHADTWTTLHLSRLDACFVGDGYALACGYQAAGGKGLRLDTETDGTPLSFWIPEVEWCAWLAPQLALPSFAAAPVEYHEVLATHTLARLNDFLSANGLPACGAARISPAAPPAEPCWRLLFSEGARCLPLYVMSGSIRWVDAVLAALPSDSQQTRILALSLGWVLVPRAEWTTLTAGDALLLEGADDALSLFWLNGPQNLGRLRLDETGNAEVAYLASAAVATPPHLIRLDAEIGTAAISCTTLADFRPGLNLPLTCIRHPEIRLTHRGKTLALGQLLQLDDGLAIRLSAIAMPRSKT
ncbi:hypothetical protein [Chitinimonas sp. BJB300]|uniref:hypothetical protein n=1 Tax=Chitinimonas sp. BJB300 TaxID=1559339 RepID=UPI000C0ECD72|nr:hypothetical protein [Chitinimonas sp. BJB300]PHV11478.1 hypothetical protein CSQ89_10625 [Chitinimonas sp. BJB300]TSJ88525.1 hypothetical protein FG002_010160 [Chitinimonas sp. BJB300]